MFLQASSTHNPKNRTEQNGSFTRPEVKGKWEGGRISRASALAQALLLFFFFFRYFLHRISLYRIGNGERTEPASWALGGPPLQGRETSPAGSRGKEREDWSWIYPNHARTRGTPVSYVVPFFLIYFLLCSLFLLFLGRGRCGAVTVETIPRKLGDSKEFTCLIRKRYHLDYNDQV